MLGPLLYSLYTSPLGDTARKHGITFHQYTDHTKVYLSLMSNCPNYYISSGKERQLSCVTDIGDWMLCNKLKLNQDKMEVLVVSSRFRPRPPLNHVQIGDDVIRPCEHARNVGVGFDQYFDFSEHVKMTTKIAFFRICGIAKIRRHLSHDTSKTIVHAYITSRLDYYQVDRLQLVQNSAARLVTALRNHDHITPILRPLHWLPVRYRIIFKISLLIMTYKAPNGHASTYSKTVDIRLSSSVTVFKTTQKTYLFTNSFDL